MRLTKWERFIGLALLSVLVAMVAWNRVEISRKDHRLAEMSKALEDLIAVRREMLLFQRDLKRVEELCDKCDERR